MARPELFLRRDLDASAVGTGHDDLPSAERQISGPDTSPDHRGPDGTGLIRVEGGGATGPAARDGTQMGIATGSRAVFESPTRARVRRNLKWDGIDLGHEPRDRTTLGRD